MTAQIDQATMPLHVSVAANVRAALGYHRATQAEVGELLGLSQVSVSERLNGHTPFTLDELGQLAPRLGLTPEDLVAGGRTPRVPPTGRGLLPIIGTEPAVNGRISLRTAHWFAPPLAEAS